MKTINCHTLGEMCTCLLDGEPVFVIRAQDQLSVEILEKYRYAAAITGATNVGRTQDAINTFKKWQSENHDRVKLPG